MAVSASFLEYVKDVLAGLGPIRIGRMFSGAGVYADGVMFGLIAGDVLYFKADEGTKAAYEAEGLGPFVYGSKTKLVATSYWRVPERLFEDPDEMVVWARAALDVARRRASSKAARAKKRNTKAK